MELSCFTELSGLEQLCVITAIVLGALFLILGAVLAVRKKAEVVVLKPEKWKWLKWAKWKWLEWLKALRSVSLPMSLACILLGILLLFAATWWLWRTFPSRSIEFSQKAWTLAEVKERLERISRIEVVLNGEASAFVLDRPFAGSCASDILISICNTYETELQCETKRKGVFSIGRRGERAVATPTSPSRRSL